jgi:hypothetical protein
MTVVFSENRFLNIPKSIAGGTLFVALIFLAFPTRSQTTVVTDSPVIKGTTVVIPGLEFKKSGYHNFWLGKHYRKEWATPVRVNNFCLDSTMGGLVPTEESGSRQTQGLRLKNSNGKEYVLRSIDKDFSRAFPDDFQGTFLARTAKDQASIGHPYSAITITPMIQATGIYHTNPKVVFLPSQDALGNYNLKYGNQLYLFEERPDDNQEDADNFGNSKNVIGSDKLFEHIYEDNDNRVDQKALAKARLFDMFIGDWGRHPDNWRWAKFDERDSAGDGGKINVYRPIPRDRDQAYTKFDGFWPWIAINIMGATQLESFDYKLHNTKRFNRPGWVLDRPFTNELTEKDWLDAAEQLQKALTDSVIEYGVHQLPPEVFSISGPVIIAKLKSRRDHLQDYAHRYYNFLSHHVELRGTNDREFFEIKRLSDNATQINIYKITKEGKVKDKPYYSRTFNSIQTREIRIYSLAKADIFKVTGPPRGVKVRIIDPDVSDSIYREKKGRTKISMNKEKFRFDSLHTKKYDFFLLPFFGPAEYKVFEDDPMHLFTKTGVRISANIRYNAEPWRTPKYLHTHIFSANYGFLRTALNFGYVGKFNHAVGPFDLLLKARYDWRAVENYFGTGNETPKAIDTRNYYRLFSRRVYGGVGLSLPVTIHQVLDLSVFYQGIKVENKGSHFVTSDHAIDSTLFDKNHFGGVELAYRFQRTNNDRLPTKGIDFLIAADYMQNLTETSRHFQNFVSTLSIYIPLGRSFTIASRAGGATLIGDADFYHLNKLGGYTNLRGYDRERFTGKTVFYNNNELRWATNTKNIFFNGQLGLFAFYDQGRVWQPLEVSNTWHNGYGAGFFIVPFNRAALTVTYATSTEGPFIQFKVGFLF